MLEKPDNNSARKSTPIVSRRFKLTEEGFDFIGKDRKVMVNRPEDGGLIEGPFIVHENGKTYLFVSSDNFANRNYNSWFSEISNVADGKAKRHELLLSSDSPALRGMWDGPGHLAMTKVPNVDSLYKVNVDWTESSAMSAPG